MTRLSDDVISPEQSSVLRIEQGAAATSKKKKSFLKNSTITNKRGRHANLSCHGEEGVSFWGCLFTRKLLQHHGNDPVPFPLQQADRQVHSFSHILSKQGLVWFTECFIFLFWKASQGHFLSEDCESLRRRKQNRSRQHVGPDTSWTTKMISLTSESKRTIMIQKEKEKNHQFSSECEYENITFVTETTNVSWLIRLILNDQYRAQRSSLTEHDEFWLTDSESV